MKAKRDKDKSGKDEGDRPPAVADAGRRDASPHAVDSGGTAALSAGAGAAGRRQGTMETSAVTEATRAKAKDKERNNGHDK